MSYRKARVSYRRDIYYIACLLTVMIGAVFCIWGPGGFLELKRMQEDLQARQTRMGVLKRSNGERSQRIQDLIYSRPAQESFVRQKEYARPDELILLLPQKPPARPDPGPVSKPRP